MTLTAAAWGQEPEPRLEGLNAGLGATPPGVQRQTPAAAWRFFLSSVEGKAFAKAAHVLNLSEVRPADQRKVGEVLSEQLARVLARLAVRRDAVNSDVAEGPLVNGQPVAYVVAARFERAGLAGEVALQRVVDPASGEPLWLFSPQTVASVPFWFRVLVKGEPARGAEPVNPGLGPVPDEVRRGSPRETLGGFFDACHEGRFDLAAFFLDLGDLEADRQRPDGSRLARRFNLALQRTLWVDLDAVSSGSLGTPEAAVPENEESFGVVKLRRKPLDLRVSHRWDPELGHVWLVSKETVAAIDRLYAVHGYGWLGDHAPVMLFAVSFGGLQLWQWLALLVGIGAGWIVSRRLGRWSVLLARRLAVRTAATWDDAVVEALDGPAGLLTWSLLLFAISPLLGLSPDVRRIAFTVCRVLAVLGIGWLLLRLVDTTAARMRRRAGGENQVGLGFLPIFVRFGKALVALLVALGTLDAIGVNVVGVFAGLGLGGIALAFAAQKTLENVFGAVAIAGDKPFQVGDYVAIGTDTGTVEDVGLRSTQLRTLARTLVSIPNGLVVAGRVENFTSRDRILYNPTLGLVYGTTAAQLRTARDGIKEALATHPRVYQGEHRVRMRAFGDSSLNLEVLCWVATTSFEDYLEVVEDLNFRFAEVVEGVGSSFAFPTRTVVVQRGAGRG